MSQDHHLIPNQVYNDAIRFLNSIGYMPAAQNAESNLVNLPNSLAAALNGGDAVHVGSHPAYNEFIQSLIDEIQTQYKADFSPLDGGAAAKANALQNISAIQSYARNGLLGSEGALSSLALNAKDAFGRGILGGQGLSPSTILPGTGLRGLYANVPGLKAIPGSTIADSNAIAQSAAALSRYNASAASKAALLSGAAGVGSRMLKLAGPAGLVLGVGVTGAKAASQFSNGDTRGGTQTLVGFAGGLLGGILTGAAVGTLVGGPFGTLAGGIIGFGAGIAGGFAGERLANNAFDQVWAPTPAPDLSPYGALNPGQYSLSFTPFDLNAAQQAIPSVNQAGTLNFPALSPNTYTPPPSDQPQFTNETITISEYYSPPSYSANLNPTVYTPNINYQAPQDVIPANPVSYNYTDFDPGNFGGFGGDDSGFPVVLALNGSSINITQLSSSDMFFDMTGDGHKNHTAWAGVNNAVLFLDPNNTGTITQANQIIFTDWDPSASSDLQALEDVFDTNHDGSLDAGDADFSEFKLMVTNANGTTSVETLAAAGITSINLTANAVNQELPDGSSIDGETTYTTSSGTTGTAATVSFADDANGYVVATTSATNADGSETITNIAQNADGSIAYEEIQNTLISSGTVSGVATTTTSRTLTDLNNGGVVATIQTDNTVVSGGTVTEVLTNYAGGTISSTGELTASSLSASELLNRTSTTTVSSGGTTTVTILRDQLGGGWTTQKEIDTTGSNGSSSIVISSLNSNGSVSDVTSTLTVVTSSGSTRSVTDEVDGSAAYATGSVDAIVISGGTQTETVTSSGGTTLTSYVSTTTVTNGATVSRTILSDLANSGTLNLTTDDQTTTTSSGSVTSQTDYAANGTELDATVTVQTLQTSGGLVTSVTSYELNGTGGLVETGTQTTTIVISGTLTVTSAVSDSANDTLLSETITSATQGSAAGAVTTYGNGDGTVTQSEVVTVSGGVTSDTQEDLNGDGSLIDETLTVTASGGLAQTIYTDTTGMTSSGSPVFDHITSDVTVSSGGVSSKTVTDYGATTSTLIDRTQTIVNNNGLTTVTNSAFTSASLASGTWDQVTSDVTSVITSGANSGGLSEVTTVYNGGSVVLSQTNIITSANRETVTSSSTLGSTGLVSETETAATQSNGTVVDTVIEFDKNGDVLDARVTSTTADGLTQIVDYDYQGQSSASYVASGLIFNLVTSDVTVINSDGSQTETTSLVTSGGTVLSSSSTTTSANGLSITTSSNPYATSHYAIKTTDVTTLNSDGSQTETVGDYNYSGTLIDQTTTSTNADGLSVTTLHDFNGDGVTDQSTTDVTTINANGTQTEVVTDYTGTPSGTVRDVTTTSSGIIVASAGLETIIDRASYGSVPTYQVETIVPASNGTVSDTTQYYASSGGALLLTTAVISSANGLTVTSTTAVSGHTSKDFWTVDTTVLDSDGGETETVANYTSATISGGYVVNGGTLIGETVTSASANGLSSTTEVDANGAGNSSSGAIFNRITTDNTALIASNGATVETVTTSNSSGGTISQTVTSTSADQQTVTTSRYLDETGSPTHLDQVEVVQTQSNGSIVDTTSSYGSSGGFIGMVVRSSTGNGLSSGVTYYNSSSATVDTQTDNKTYVSNGGTVEVFTDSDITGGTTLTTSRTTTTSANDQATITALILAGALASTNTSSFSATTSDTTSIADTGVTTETITDALNGSSGTNDTTTVVTAANQLTKTTSTSLGSAGAYIVDVSSQGLDGSKLETTTYYNPSSVTFIEEKTTVSTSYDGRTITTTRQFDYDGTKYNVETDTYIENANNTTTETRSDTGSFGAPALTQTITLVTNTDSSEIETTLDFDAAGTLKGQIIADVSPDGLIKSFAYDTNGQESSTTLAAAAADLIANTALPTTMLPTDIIELDTTVLNADGSTSETEQTAYGDSLSNLRSETTITTSANGLVVTTDIDNDGNGVFEQKDTTTTNPDGSKTEVYSYYGDTPSTSGTVTGSDTYTSSANGLTTTLTTTTGIADTTVDFADSNGSSEFSRTVVTGSSADNFGYADGSASHEIDANGIDTWSWNDGYTGDATPNSGTIQIDLATEQQDIAIANQLFVTLLGHEMDDAETQYSGQYISSGVFDRQQQALDLIESQEYADNFTFTVTGGTLVGGYYQGTQLVAGFDVIAAFENALGRLPTAEEMGVFDQYMHTSAGTNSIDSLATMTVALAQYATQLGASNNRTQTDPDQDLLTTAPAWINPATSLVTISTGGTSALSEYFINENGVSGVTINGGGNVILAQNGAVFTVSGFDNAIDNLSGTVSVTASGAAILVEAGGIETVTGNNNQISQVGPTKLTLTSGSGNEIYVASAAAISSGTYSSSFAITSASSASITLGSGSSGSLSTDQIYGNGNTISEGGYASALVSGTSNSIDITGTSATASLSAGTVTLEAGVAATISGNADSITLKANAALVAVGTSDTVNVIGAGATASLSSGSVTIGSGGTAVVSGSNDSVTVSAGGTLELLGSSSLSGVTLLSGAALEIGSGYTLSGYAVSSGITLEVLSSGTISNTTISSGASLELFGGALSSGSRVISSGGTLEVASGYSLSGFAVSDGVTLQVTASGTASSTTIQSAGTLSILSGGTASGFTISSGGDVSVLAGGALEGGAIIAGGTLDVSSGATLTGSATITSGGLISALGSFNENVTFSGAGEFSVAQPYSGVISGFALRDSIDFAAVPFTVGDYATWQSTSGSVETFAIDNSNNSVLTTFDLASPYPASLLSLGADTNGNILLSSSQILADTNDFTGSGTSDILLQDSSDDFVDWIINSSTVTSGNYLGTNTGWTIAGTGDFNGNGISDALLVNSDSTVDWSFANGLVTSGAVIGNTAGYNIVATGDFTGGGTSDILLQNSSGTIVDWMVSNGVVTSGNSLGSVPGWNVVGTGDFTGNGVDDALLVNSSNGNVVDWTMSNGLVSSGIVIGNTDGYSIVGTGDFTGNGTSDILLQNSTGDLVDWMVSSGAVTSGNYLGNFSGWSVAATGDYNGNGISDILLTNSAGAVESLAMSNGLIASSATLGNTAGYTIKA